MPEGPEVYYLSRWLYKQVVGQNLIGIKSNTKSKVSIPKKSKVVDVDSKGKLFWIKTEDYYLHIHLGLSGWLTLEKPRIFKYVLKFDHKEIYLEDQRRFSKLLVTTGEKSHRRLLNQLGIDILKTDFTLENFTKKIKEKRVNITSFLLDQKNFAGIGNYIRNDALYLARISPKRNTSTLSESEIKKLFKAIRFIGYANKGSGYYQHRVYGRTVDAKGRRIRFEKFAGRKTFWVPSLQK